MDYFPKLIFSIPWGNSMGAIPASPIPLVRATGAFPPSSKRYIRPLYGVRIDTQGNIYILFPIVQEAQSNHRMYRLLNFNHEAELINCFDFSLMAKNVQTWNILDFAPDHEGGIIVLELLQTQKGKAIQRLRKFDSEGRRKWERKGTLSFKAVNFKKFEGHFNRICVLDKNLFYLPAHFPQHGMARLNPSSGKTTKIFNWKEYPERVTIGSDNKVYYAHLIEGVDSKKIVLIRYDISSGRRDVIESDIQNLHNLAGIDSSGAVYPRIHNGIARLSAEGKLQWKEHLYGIVLRESDKHIFLCNRAEFNSEKVVLSVDRYDLNGARVQTYTFQCRRQQFAIGNDLPRLIHVDSDFLFYFHGGESVDDAGIMVSFTHDGKLQETVPLSKNADDTTLFDKLNDRVLPIESRIGLSDMIEIDISGRIYVPISDPAGFKVICFQPENVEK